MVNSIPAVLEGSLGRVLDRVHCAPGHAFHRHAHGLPGSRAAPSSLELIVSRLDRSLSLGIPIPGPRKSSAGGGESMRRGADVD